MSPMLKIAQDLSQSLTELLTYCANSSSSKEVKEMLKSFNKSQIEILLDLKNILDKDDLFSIFENIFEILIDEYQHDRPEMINQSNERSYHIQNSLHQEKQIKSILENYYGE